MDFMTAGVDIIPALRLMLNIGFDVPDAGFVKCLYAPTLRNNGGLNMLPIHHISDQ
jgi:hypothetical protein